MYKIPANTLFIGKKIIYVPECHSTNHLATQTALQPSALEGTVVITDRQTMGKGQRGNQWLTEHYQNLTFSLILRPTFLDPKDQFALNMVIALAVHDFLKNIIHGQVLLKWPNDVMVSEKKIAGILIENQLQGNRFIHAIAGLGLNVNQEIFPMASATSLVLETREKFPLAEVLIHVLECIEARYLQLKQGNFQTLKREYLNVLYRRDVMHTYITSGQQVKGTIKGVDHFGRLHLDVDGQHRFYDVRELEYVS